MRSSVPQRNGGLILSLSSSALCAARVTMRTSCKIKSTLISGICSQGTGIGPFERFGGSRYELRESFDPRSKSGWTWVLASPVDRITIVDVDGRVDVPGISMSPSGFQPTDQGIHFYYPASVSGWGLGDDAYQAMSEERGYWHERLFGHNGIPRRVVPFFWDQIMWRHCEAMDWAIHEAQKIERKKHPRGAIARMSRP